MNLADLDVPELCGLFENRLCSPTDLIEDCLDRTERVDRTIRAYVHLDSAGARLAAKQSTERWEKGAPLSRLDGIPVAVKANIAVAGWPHHAGIGAYRDHMSSADAISIAQLRSAGAVFTGMVNMHEGAFGVTTDNPWFGRTCNPCNTDRTCGGSSGGSGAVIAARMAALALGSDTVGSSRIPAAFTGTFGFKPPHGEVSHVGLIPMAHGVDTIGLHARSAESCRILFDVLRQSDKTVESSTARRKIAILDVSSYAEVDPDVHAAFQRVVGRAEALGYNLVRVRARFACFEVLSALGLICAGDASATFAKILTKEDDISATLRERLLEAGGRSAVDFSSARMTIERAADATRTMMKGCIALLTPTTPHVAPRFDGYDHTSPVVAFTMLANITRLPAIAFPSGIDVDGLPISAHIMSWDSGTALRLAEQLAVMLPEECRAYE